MTTTVSPEDAAIAARAASAQVRAAAGRLRQSVEIIETRAALMTSAERRRLLARAAGIILDAFAVREAAEKTIPASAPAIYAVLIRQETSSLMAGAAMAIRKVAGGAYAALYDKPVALALAVAEDLQTMGAKPKATNTAAATAKAARTAFDRARRSIRPKSDEEEAAANEQTCPTCGQPMPADTDGDEPQAGDDGKPHDGEDRKPASHRHKHWLTHSVAVIARKSAEGKPLVRVTASSDVEDLEQDVFEMSALKEMRAGFVGKLAFMNHRYSVPADVFGTITETALHKRGDNTYLDMTIEVAAQNPAAMQTHEMIAQGIRLGVSVGVLLRESTRRDGGGFSIKHVVPLEASIVGIPANQTAWTTGAKRLRGAALREAKSAMAIKS